MGVSHGHVDSLNTAECISIILGSITLLLPDPHVHSGWDAVEGEAVHVLLLRKRSGGGESDVDTMMFTNIRLVMLISMIVIVESLRESDVWLRGQIDK